MSSTEGLLVTKRRTRKKLKPDTESSPWPNDLSRSVLLIRWSTLKDVQEIDLALRAFRADSQIAAHDARDSDDVIDTIKAWLSIGKSQLLYIGSHGNSEGLKPTTKTYPELTWNRLAGALRKAPERLWVCLGACDSASAAAAWERQNDDFPASVLIAFRSNRTEEAEVGDSLLKLLELSGFYSAGSLETRAELESITTIEEDITSLKPLSDRIVVFKRALDSGKYEIVDASHEEPNVAEEQTSEEESLELLDDWIEDLEEGEPDPDLD
ncbi:hypothetical protein HNQ77_002253 [Silvibacterium bohemicum]|uniref:Uncharacterized protein n=1 Tax=Silvibacterium bohemicum TaxID=1577686 RepID=A0A841JZB4_9BACT|nr:hypothetical protein [Silvibacterium bohemicum]MBB6144301.1 hypothetical protein [Silvibacterium bohemicum]